MANIDWIQTWAVIFTGIIVTFVVLMLLWFCVELMGKTINLLTGGDKKKINNAPLTNPIAKITPPIQTDDKDIIAVIMAAITAMGSGYTLRSIKRSVDGAELWAAAGRKENTSGL